MSKIHAALFKAERERAVLDAQREHGRVEGSFASNGGPSGSDHAPVAPHLADGPQALPRFAEAKWKLDAAYLFEPWWPRENVEVASEEFRGLASSLQVARSRAPLATLLISSVLPGEGKTTTSLNLAYALAQSENRVLLVDGDLRNPKLHAVFGVENTLGLANFLQGSAEPAAIVQEGPVPNLYFAPSGVASRHPSELITSPRFPEFLQWAKQNFVWVVMDTAPAAIVSDASLMAHHFEGVLLVVQSGSTPYDLAQQVRASLSPERLLGVVLNRGETGRVNDSYYYRPARAAGKGEAPGSESNVLKP
jgi:capsular exopolysaccharide synthesis family protein